MKNRTILIFIAKPKQMSFGGNDTFAIQLARNWALENDRIVFVYNATNPCRADFETQLKDRVILQPVDEPMTWERRLDLQAQYKESPAKQYWLEFCDDLARPFKAVASISRFYRLLNRYEIDVAFLTIGGNPPEDLGWRIMIAAWLRRTRQIILVNQSYPGKGTTFLRRLFLIPLRALTQFFCDVVVAPSKDMARVFKASMNDKRAPVVIPYGIDSPPPNEIPLDEKRKRLDLADGLIIGAVGNFEERKGMHILVQAMPTVLREFPDASLVLIGSPTDMAYTERVNQTIKRLGLEKKIRSMGFMHNAGLYFECFDICVVPSIYAEGFGIVAIEALRYKKPVVATYDGGLKEVIVDGETGFLVPVGDIAALAEALLKLLRSSALRAEMGRRSLERFNTCYKTETMMANYYALTERTR